MFYYLFPLAFILISAVLTVIFRDKFTRISKKSKINYIFLSVLLTGLHIFMYVIPKSNKTWINSIKNFTFIINLITPLVCALYLAHLFLGEKFEKSMVISTITEKINSKEFSKIIFFGSDNYLARVKKAIVPAVLFPFMYFVFGPTELFFANVSEWDFIYTDFIFYAIAAALIFTGIFGFAIPALLKGRAFNVLTVVFSAITLMSYLQNLLFSSTLGTLDGKYVDWIFQNSRSVFNCLLWVAVITVMLVLFSKFKDKFFKVSNYLMAAVIAVHLVWLPVLVVYADETAFKHTSAESEWDLSGDEQFTVSDNENVIIFVLDSFGKEQFEEYCATNEQHCELLKDFTFFDNVNTEYRITCFSMPYIFTTTPFDPTCSIIDSNKNAWNSESANYFYSEMQKNGYTANLYVDSEMYMGGAENMRGKISNVEEYTVSGYTADNLKLMGKFFKLSSYRLAPDCLKNFFWMYPSYELNSCVTKNSRKIVSQTDDWRSTAADAIEKGICHYNYDFYNGLNESGLTATDNGKYFIVQFLWGTHEPYMGLTPPKNELDFSTTPKEATDSCMTLLSNYFDELKRIGVYDKSTIIVTADHSNSYLPGHTAPTLLIKRAGDTHDQYAVNSAPVNLQTDILPTVLDCVGIDYKPLGVSAFSLDEDAQRTRCQYFTKYDTSYPAVSKCSAVGNAKYNVLYKYTYEGRESNVDENNYEIVPIFDFWW